MDMKTRDETIADPREKLGREPSQAEVDAARELLIRRAYADMAMTARCFKGEMTDPVAD
jgi:hypothetical protein